MAHNDIWGSYNILRKSILKVYFSHPLNVIDFYDYLSRLVWIPILGNPLLKSLINFYGLHYHSGRATPLFAVIELIKKAKDIVVVDCSCRVRKGDCSYSVRTCLKINTAAEIELKYGALRHERITKEEAIRIVEESVKNTLILSVEWCINPYTYAICSCCECCCVSRELRFKRGIEGALLPSEYLPQYDENLCTLCFSCQDVCPAQAVSFNNEHFKLNPKMCVGCGLCANVCPTSALRMEKKRKIKDKKRGFLYYTFIFLSTYLFLFPLAFIFVLFKGKRKSYKNA